MDRLLEFAGNHTLLVLALAAAVVAIIVNELRLLRAGTSKLEPAAATLLFNREEAVFLDIRGEADYQKAHLPQAVHCPASQLTERLAKLERYKERPLIVYCAQGVQSGRTAQALTKAGFPKVYELRGGIQRWLADGLPTDGK